MVDRTTKEDEGRALAKLMQGVNQADFAKSNELPGGASMLSQHLSGHRPISLVAAGIYARGLGVPISSFSMRLAQDAANLRAAEQSDVGERIEIKRIAQLPLVGEVKAGPDGYLEELQYPVGHGEGTVEYPTSDPNAYALRVRGDSMHPRYRAGEFVIVEPSIEPQEGDDVVVLCVNTRKMLKQLNWRRGDEVQLTSINNGYAPITLQRKEITSIQLVAGRARRDALRK